MSLIEIQKISDRVPHPQKTSLEAQIQSLSPDVRSVAESLAMRDMESAKRYLVQYLAVNRKFVLNGGSLQLRYIYAL
jgi:hypothetical protein